ncbi:MAG: Magnesium-transporting ATPase, P-type 1 [Actinomycetota bacterium]
MTSFQGLTAAQAKSQLERFGPNAIRVSERYASLKLLLSQFTDPIMLLLLGATLLAMLLGEVADSLIILAIVIPTALLSFYQEHRAGQELKALLDRVKQRALVYRDSELVEVGIDELVPDDIVSLSVGTQIPADLELLETNQLQIDESALTGESFPVEKIASDLVFLGTHVAGGSAIARIVATGSNTKYGELARRLATTDQKTSFEQGSAQFGRFLMRVMVVLVVSIFVVNILVDRSLFDSLLFSLALAVGLTPQLLTVIITISLTRGASKMAKERVLVKRLDAIQDFGSMTVLCSDKTGTLTLGDMRLVSWEDIEGAQSANLLKLAAINAGSQTSYQNPIDLAILNAAKQESIGTTAKALAEVPYDFERRRLSVAVELSDTSQKLLITKGAFTDLLAICDSVRTKDGTAPIEQFRDQLLAQQTKHASEGKRVLLLASKQITSHENLKEQESHLTAEGLLVFFDPIKPEAAQSINKLKNLGIRTVIVTGDNPITTAQVASEVGLPTEPFFTGQDIDQMGHEQLAEATKTAAFFAAVNPIQKERIIKAMGDTQETVGYFGDGINDALALRAADVGISVDNAVDVAKESADIVLLDKDLDVLSDGVRIGRSAFANTMTYIRVTISASFGNVVSVVVAAAFLPFLPLLPVQILLLNFLSDIPHIAIATDRVDDEDLVRPKSWEIKSLRRFMLIFGLLSTVVDLILYWLLVGVFEVSPDVFRSVWFIESLLSELVAMLVLRTRKSFWRSRPGPILLLACLVFGVVAIAITFMPFTATLLGFGAPPIHFLGFVAVLLVLYAAANELLKKRFMV